MKKYLILVTVLLASICAGASAKTPDLEQLGRDYFAAFVATQEPDATKQDVENYLAFLTDDVGHQHFPNSPDDSRARGNKARARKGMTHYLGGNSSFEAKLESITTGKDVIVLKYKQRFAGYHQQLKKEVGFASDVIEVLEIENGKVSVIRTYAKSL
ncbi:nuclear transport factor 2 family protein [Microbulbifer sp. SAOS-129_SWC]|uniref:nuclear transport factor 2 family protein n=1 Tax=Microbulbifer sp. SAOS-129_SWC TaxID=3145235 RepID=UPI003216C290